MSNTSSPTEATAHAGPPRPHETTLPQLVAAQATRTPRATALIRGEDRLTYGELDAWAQAIAGQLAQRGVRLEDRVGICAERSFEMVAGMLGILYAGAAYVPLGLDWPTARLSGALGDAEVRVVLVTANGEEHLRGNRGATTIPITPLRDDSIHGSRAYDADVAPEHLAYVIFTSGTTAQPKGVMISHRAICNRLLWMQTEYDTDASDVFIQKTPYTFDVSVWELLLPLICGAQVVLAEPDGHRDTRYLLELMRAHDVTTAHFVPSMLRRFLEDPELSSLTSLKRVICSGEALPYEVMQRFFARLDARLDNLYGPTEAAVDVSFWRCRPDYGSRAVPIGKAIDNIKLDVLDGNLRELPQGETGEVAGRLAAIQRDAEGASDALPVGCLTHFSRAPLWGRTRAELKRVQANAAALQRVQRAGLAVCLDTDAIPATDLQRTAQTLSLDETTRTATGRTQAIEWHATPRVATAAKVAASAPSPVVNCVELPGIGEEFWRSNRLPAPAAVLVVLAIAWTRALDGRVPLIVDTLDARHAVGGRVVFYQIMTDPIADAVRALAARSTDGRPWADCFRATTRLCAVRRQAAVAGTVGLNWCRPTGNVLGTLLGITGSLLSGSRRPQAVFTGIMPVTPGAPRWQGETMRYNYTFCQLLADRVCASTGGLEKVGELTRCAAEVLEQLPEVAT